MVDYSVELGQGNCSMESLLDNALFCLPPSQEPDIDPTHGSVRKGEPVLVVRLLFASGHVILRCP